MCKVALYGPAGVSVFVYDKVGMEWFREKADDCVVSLKVMPVASLAMLEYGLVDVIDRLGVSGVVMPWHCLAVAVVQSASEYWFMRLAGWIDAACESGLGGDWVPAIEVLGSSIVSKDWSQGARHRLGSLLRLAETNRRGA